MRSIAGVFILLSLIFSVTNYVPLSVSLIFLAPLAFISLCCREGGRFSKAEGYLMALFIYIILSTLVYNKSSFMDFDFYRKDGNFFISYLVLFVFLFMPVGVSLDTHRWTMRAFAAFFLISCAGFVLMPKETAENGSAVHHFFFVSHNAAGGFYSVVASVALGLYMQTRRKICLFYTVAFLFFLYHTDSRGSLLAIMTAAGYALLRFRRPGVVFGLYLLVQLLIVCDTWPVWVSMGRMMSENANYVVNGGGQTINFQRAGTFIDRLYYLWPRAADNFMHSPVVGMGFGSFDDLYYHYIDVVPHVYAIKDGALVRHSDAHAHNSTLTILAELGIVGYVLFVLLFAEIYKSIMTLKEHDPPMCLSLSLAFWTCVFSAATEHRITTPSQMVPFFIFWGMSWLRYSGRKRVVPVNPDVTPTGMGR